MEEKSLIYVAGNPNAYPLEYFDPNTEEFEGVIPELLEDFSAQSEYEIVYYKADGNDYRRQLAKNNQVDLLSGYMYGDSMPENDGSTVLLLASHNDKEYIYYIYFTDAATKSFKDDLIDYISTISQEEFTGLLIEEATTPKENTTVYWITGFLAAFSLLMIIAITVLVKWYGKRLKNIQQNVETDEVTGLGNMEYILRYYKQYVNDKNRILYQAVYFYADTDRLRRLSSSEATDEFLRYCAMILGEYTGDSDITARVSDSGFVMLKFTGGAGSLDKWLDNVLGRMCAYSELYSKPFDTGMSVGIYQLRAEDRDINEIIFQAAQGAYKAQKEGLNYIYCSRQMMDKFIEERQLQSSIERAFTKNEFQLYIQFYVDAHNFKIVGGEALTRWHHPQKGVLMPSVFIPLLEREKTIIRLDYYCLKEVCSFLEDLAKESIDTFFISCNFSRETFAATDFVGNVKKIIDEYTFPRELLILEITDSTSVRDSAQVRQNIIDLKEYGVRIALDDFGEGCTSFYDLQKYPIDGIKLDKGLVDYILTPSGISILKAMIQVGHELNMTILAEGVETDEQVKILQDINCDVIQGFKFFQPLPKWEANKKISENYCGK